MGGWSSGSAPTLVRESSVVTAATQLLGMAKTTTLIHMKTTLNIDDRLLAEARRLTHIEEKTGYVEPQPVGAVEIDEGEGE